MMIRLAASTSTKNNLIRRGLQHLSKPSVTYRPSSILATRSFSSAKDDEPAPKGIPYSKLTVGVPKERFPMEKRVAATPEVSSARLLKPFPEKTIIAKTIKTIMILDLSSSLLMIYNQCP